MITVLSAVLVLGILIFVHELGHFLLAKRAGVGVTTFSLGFGPKLLGFTKGGTEYRLSAIPLGGYVRMVGEHSGEELAPEDLPYAFTAKPVGWRLAIVAAGPVSNLIFAVLVYYLIIVGWGLPSLTTRVGDVVKDQPAALAGIIKGDLVIAIEGQPVDRWGQMVAAIQGSGGKPVRLTLEREGREVLATVQPLAAVVKDVFGEEHQIFRVGIIAAGETVTQQVGAFKAVGLALDRSYLAGELIVMSVVKIFQGKVTLDNVGGPIQIGQAAGQAARHGMVEFLSLMAILSVNLAILNLLPIPALDGGHVFFFLVEAITRRPVSVGLREKSQQVGVALLILLMAVIIYNDIARLVTGAPQ
jgi:regulator of sigma E protease